MLPLAKVLEVRRLLDEGELSQRKIATRLGISRGVVNSIANGRRGLHGRETKVKYSCDDQEAVAERCRGCGAMVYMPCLLCRARQYREREQRSSEQAVRRPRVA